MESVWSATLHCEGLLLGSLLVPVEHATTTASALPRILSCRARNIKIPPLAEFSVVDTGSQWYYESYTSPQFSTAPKRQPLSAGQSATLRPGDLSRAMYATRCPPRANTYVAPSSALVGGWGWPTLPNLGRSITFWSDRIPSERGPGEYAVLRHSRQSRVAHWTWRH
jgi:hypothetical protein